MKPLERFMAAAARDLAGSLGAAPRPGGARAAEALRREPDIRRPGPGERAALEALARAVVEAVLALEGPRLDEAVVRETVERAARKHLMGKPELPPGLAARVAGETGRLVNLPLLARLAGEGLLAGPLASALGEGAGRELVTGPSEAFARTLEELERVADTGFPVTLIGETGTGKELLARRLHRLSSRRDRAFVAVNCAALPENLLESELFGHEKGAFTGADAPREGLIRQARGGTLFLDEIGETTPAFQVRLLRVLEERAVRPLGGSREVPVDFRLVSATHRDLEEAARRGEFNRSLLYRVVVVPVWLPPLRRRREDLPVLIDHFLAQACLTARRTRRLAPETRRRMMEYRWPGNVRELSHLVQRLVALSPEYEIGPDLLPPEVGGPGLREAEAGLLRIMREANAAPGGRLEALAGLLAERGGGYLANRDIREELLCSDTTAKNILGGLVRAGLLEPQGTRGGRRYLVKETRED